MSVYMNELPYYKTSQLLYRHLEQIDVLARLQNNHSFLPGWGRAISQAVAATLATTIRRPHTQDLDIINPLHCLFDLRLRGLRMNLKGIRPATRHLPVRFRKGKRRLVRPFLGDQRLLDYVVNIHFNYSSYSRATRAENASNAALVNTNFFRRSTS